MQWLTKPVTSWRPLSPWSRLRHPQSRKTKGKDEQRSTEGNRSNNRDNRGPKPTSSQKADATKAVVVVALMADIVDEVEDRERAKGHQRQGKKVEGSRRQKTCTKRGTEGR